MKHGTKQPAPPDVIWSIYEAGDGCIHVVANDVIVAHVAGTILTLRKDGLDSIGMACRVRGDSSLDPPHKGSWHADLDGGEYHEKS
jgi:hypothetical protein